MTDKLIPLSRTLRKNTTDAERVLWKYLRGKQFDGFKFRRQEPIGKYIADFVCYDKKIIIEVDGGQHAVDTVKDEERDRWFEGQGFKVLRFWNNDVLGNMEGVFEAIKRNT